MHNGKGTSAVVFLTVPDFFPVEASFHLLCATIPGVVASCMENSTNVCPLISEMSKRFKR